MDNKTWKAGDRITPGKFPVWDGRPQLWFKELLSAGSDCYAAWVPYIVEGVDESHIWYCFSGDWVTYADGGLEQQARSSYSDIRFGGYLP